MSSIPSRLIHVLLFALLFGTLPGGSMAKQAKDIDWETLIPPPSESLAKELDELQARIAGLDATQRFLFHEIDDQVWLKRRIELGFIDPNDLSPAEQARVAIDYESEHPELFALWKRVQKARLDEEAASERINASLNEQSVRIPGYLLPLETEGLAIREFLLVPFVGACIHVPPPPANQMVYVQLDQPYKAESLFEAVWVEGVISTKGGKHELYHVDGESDVNAGYSIRAINVSKHSR